MTTPGWSFSAKSGSESMTGAAAAGCAPLAAAVIGATGADAAAVLANASANAAPSPFLAAASLTPGGTTVSNTAYRGCSGSKIKCISLSAREWRGTHSR